MLAYFAVPLLGRRRTSLARIRRGPARYCLTGRPTGFEPLNGCEDFTHVLTSFSSVPFTLGMANFS